MSTGQRLPEDIAAEQAYLAELRAKQEAAERQRAEARRQELAALGLLDTPAPPRDVLAPPAASAPVEVQPVSAPAAPSPVTGPLGSPPPATPASLSPEALAALPPEVRELVEEALARKQADNAAAPAALPPSPPPSPDFAQPTAAVPSVALESPTLVGQALPAAAPASAAQRELTEEEIERLEKVVLGEVQVHLADKDSVLVRGRSESFVQKVGSTLDGMLGLILGRNKTW